MQTSKLTNQGDASLFQNYDFARLAEKVRGAFTSTVTSMNNAFPKKPALPTEEDTKAKFKRLKTLYDDAQLS